MKLYVRKNVIRSMLVKEFKQVFRDGRMIFILFASPIILLFLFGYAVNTDVQNVRTAFLDEDRTPQSRALIERFTASGYFLPRAWLTSEKEIDGLMDHGEAELYIHIEKGFAKRIKSGKGASIQVILDGTDSSRSSLIRPYVNEIVSEYSFENLDLKKRMVLINRNTGALPVSRSVEMKERIFFNPELKSRNYFMPGVVGLLITMVTVVLTAMAVVKEREAGTLEQIIVSPLRPIEFIIGKTAPFSVIGFVDVCLVTFIAIAWFDVPFKGSVLFLFLVSILYILASLAAGLYISTISRTQQQALLTTFLFLMPSTLFCGFAFPIYAMPEVIQIIAYLNPLTYFLEILRGIFLKGVGPLTLWREVLVLTALTIGLLVLSVMRFNKRME